MGPFTFWEILLILVVVLLLFGAKRIPEIAGSMGKGIKEFKRSLTDVERSINDPEPRDRLRDAPRDPVRTDAASSSNDDDRPAPRRLLQ